jgi:hypothetical protein
MLKFFFSLLFSFLFSQTEVIVVDSVTAVSLQDVEVLYDDEISYSKENGSIYIRNLNKGDSILFKLLGYEDKYLLYNPVVRKDTIKLVQLSFVAKTQIISANKTGFNTETIVFDSFRDPLLLRSSESIENYIESSNIIEVTKNVAQESTIQLFGSHENELQITLNQLNLYNFTRGQNILSPLLPISVKQLNLHLGSSGPFVGQVKADLNYSENKAKIYFGENELAFSNLLNFREYGLLIASKYSILRDNLEIEKGSASFNFNSRMQNIAVTAAHLYDNRKIALATKLLTNVKRTDFLLDSDKKEESAIASINLQSKKIGLTLSNTFQYLNDSYTNSTDPFSIIKLNENILENKISLQYKNPSYRYFSSHIEHLSLENEYRGEKSYDQLSSLMIQLLYDGEKDANFELSASASRYHEKFYFSALKFKNNINFEYQEKLIQMYFDFSASRTPTFKTQLLFVDPSSSFTSPKISYSQKIIVGFKFNVFENKIDFNYTNKIYENNSFKIFDIVDYRLRFYELAKSEGIQLGLKRSLASELDLDLSASYSSFFPIQAFSNRPSLLFQGKLTKRFESQQVRVSASFGSDLYSLYISEGFYKRARIASYEEIDVKYSYLEVLENVNIVFTIDNLLKTERFFSNGFKYRSRKLHLGIEYVF